MDEGANNRVIQKVIPEENYIQPQTKSVRVYRDGKKLPKLEAGAVASFIASNDTAKIHYGGGQITRIDLKGPEPRKTHQFGAVVDVGFKNYWHHANLNMLGQRSKTPEGAR